MSRETVATANGRTGRRIVHWVVAGAFVVMFGTGLIFFVDALSSLAAGGATRYLHRAAAVFLVGTPIVYSVLRPGAARQWLAEAVLWKGPTPAGPRRTWKRLHKSLVASGYVLIVITGGISWFLKGNISSASFQAVVTVHDVVFIGAICVLLYHFYYEFDWWMWKRKFCHDCASLACADICPNGVMVPSRDGGFQVYSERCNNCRLCMQTCRRRGYYRKGATGTAESPEPGPQAKHETTV